MTKRAGVLLSQLVKKIEELDADSQRHKRMHRRLRTVILVLTGVAMALASTALGFPAHQRTFTLATVVTTTLTSVLVAIEGYRRPGELWMHERTTFHALWDIRRTLDYHGGAEADDALADECFERMQAVLGAASQKWNREFHVRPPPDAKLEVPKLRTVDNG